MSRWPDMQARFGVDTVELQGLTFLNVDEGRFIELVVSESRQGRGGWVATPNTDILRQAHEDPQIRVLLQKADALVADGMPLVWASRLQRTPLRHGRVCGSDLIESLPVAAAAAGLSIYLLGGAGDAAERTRAKLEAQLPMLRVVGTYSPPFGFERDPRQYQTMRALVADAAPDIVFVALSFPKGEWLIQRIRDALPNAWWIGVGAAFDFVSGHFRRAPGIMKHTGTEWVFRMIQDPRRLGRRYLVHDLPYVGILFASSLRRGLVQAASASW